MSRSIASDIASKRRAFAREAWKAKARPGKVHLDLKTHSCKAACGELIPSTRIWVTTDVWSFLPHEAQCGRCATLLTRMAPHGPWATKEMRIAVEAALIGIWRELAQWQPFEHRCFSRFNAGAQSMPVCACGSTWLLDMPEQASLILFVRVFEMSHEPRPLFSPPFYTARPGTTIEVRR